MQSNTAAEALSQFLSANPERAPAAGQLLDRLGKALVAAGDAGLPIAAAMQASGLTRPEFFGVLGTATSTGLFDVTKDPAGQEVLRLTATGRSLY